VRLPTKNNRRAHRPLNRRKAVWVGIAVGLLVAAALLLASHSLAGAVEPVTIPGRSYDVASAQCTGAQNVARLAKCNRPSVAAMKEMRDET
jgi:hypothetical protein